MPSTILDLTGTVPRMLRAGALSADALRKVVPVIDLPSADGEPDMSPADRRAAEAIAAAAQATASSSGDGRAGRSRDPLADDPDPDPAPGD